MKIIGEYKSPRITSEFNECSMPLTFDQYSNCGYDCCYCFSQYIRGIGPASKNYLEKKIKATNVRKLKEVFTLAKKSDISDYIAQKMTMQWGGLSDPFCPLEEQFGVGLELLKFFNKIKYPISFSSKSDLILRDERYAEQFKIAGDLWHYKASIITIDEDKAKQIERGVPSPEKRLQVLKKLSSYGVKTTLRLRPFIIGLTDNRLDELIGRAKEAGCQSVTTEFFCLDTRAGGKDKTCNNNARISKAIGFDIEKFYRKYHGTCSGYIRLDKKVKNLYAKKFIDICKKHDIAYFFSDVDFKNHCCSGSCCGVLDSNEKLNNYSKLQVTQFIQYAKVHGMIDYKTAIRLGTNSLAWSQNTKLQSYMNLGNNRKRARLRDMTYFDYFKKIWNDRKHGENPENFTNGILKAKAKDENGNLIYFYDSTKEKI